MDSFIDSSDFGEFEEEYFSDFFYFYIYLFKKICFIYKKIEASIPIWFVYFCCNILLCISLIREEHYYFDINVSNNFEYYLKYIFLIILKLIKKHLIIKVIKIILY